MDDTIVEFETAKLACNKGFKDVISCIGGKNYYNLKGELNGDSSDELKEYLRYKKEGGEFKETNIAAPTQSVLQRWLREKYQIYVDAYFKADVINSTKVIITMISNKVYDWSDGEKVKSWDVVYNKGFPLLDEKYEFNLKQYPNNEKYKVKTFTREEALEEGLKVALKLI